MQASLFLMLLLIGDMVYIAVHFVWTETSLLDSPLAALDTDRGFAEFFQYLKLLWALVLLLCVWLRTSVRGYLAWVLVCAYLLGDDALQVHEKVGEWLVVRFGLTGAFGMRDLDVGELLVSAAAGAFLAATVGWAYYRGSEAFRQSSRHLLLLLLAIVFFGMFVDLVHGALDSRGWLDNLLIVLEDGGELVAVSFVTWYAFLLLTSDGRAGASLGGLLAGAAAHARQWVRQGFRA